MPFHRRQGKRGESHVLANQEDIHGTQIELVEERQGRKALFRRMHSSIKLYEPIRQSRYAPPMDKKSITPKTRTITVFPLY